MGIDERQCLLAFEVFVANTMDKGINGITGSIQFCSEKIRQILHI